MKPDRAFIDLAFPHPIYGTFTPIKLHLEYPLKGDETEEQAWDAGEKAMKEWIASRYPDPNQMNKNIVVTPLHFPSKHESIPTISKDKERTEIAIDNAKSIDDLQVIKDDAEKHGLFAHYMTRFYDIANGRPTEFTDGID